MNYSKKKDAALPTFEFKYFQHIEGTLLIPKEFTPHQIQIELVAKTGEKAQASFEWDAAIATTTENGEISKKDTKI